jgi:hypothetical protein
MAAGHRPPWHRALALVPILIAALAAGPARAEDAQPFPLRIGPELQETLLVSVPLGLDRGYLPPLLDHPLLLGSDTPLLASERSAIGDVVLRRWGLRLLRPEDQSIAASGHATRYSRPDAPLVQGDGRVLTLADALLVESDGARALALDVQLKGLRTPLARSDVPEPEQGRLSLEEAIADVMMSRYLRRAGVPSFVWLAILPRRDGSALLVRAGRFQRYAHLWQLRQQPARVREMLEDTFAQLAPGQPFTVAGAYRRLQDHAAASFARLYWALVAHGGLGYDNVGLLDILDPTNATALDRTHHGYSRSDVVNGHDVEGPMILRRFLQAELGERLLALGLDEVERQRVVQLRESDHVIHRYQHHMLRGLLEHLGLDRELGRHVLGRHEALVAEFFAAFLALARARDDGRPWSLGEGEEVPSRARFNALAGLTALVEHFASAAPEEARRSRLLEVLAPASRRGPAAVPEADENLVHRFWQAGEAVLAQVFAGHAPEEQRALASAYAWEAQQRNQPPVQLSFQRRRRKAQEIARLVLQGKSEEALSEMLAHGAHLQPGAGEGPAAVAVALRRDQVQRTAPSIAWPEGRLRLATHWSPALVAEELSDGVSDRLRLTLTLPARQPGVVTARLFSEGADRALLHEAEMRWLGQEGAYQLETGLELWPRTLRVEVSGSSTRASSSPALVSPLWLYPVLASPLVQGELAAWAERAGRPRPQVQTSLLAGLQQQRRQLLLGQQRRRSTSSARTSMRLHPPLRSHR